MTEQPLYLIVQKVWTSATLDGMQELENFYLVQHSDGTRRCWLAIRALQANSWREAYARTSKDLIKLIDSLHVVLQCVFSIAGASWFVWRQYHSDGIVIANIIRPSPVVALGLWNEKQRRDIEGLRNAPAAALLYFREAARASTAKRTLAMLVIAVEALAGSKAKNSKCNRCGSDMMCLKCEQENSYSATDMKEVERILGVVAYGAIYRRPENLRNKLMHGNLIDEERANEIAGLVYKRIQLHLWSTFGLESEKDIVHSPRPLDGYSLDIVCLRPGPRWLPNPVNLSSTQWAEIFAALENSNLLTFGEHIEEPQDL